MSHVTSDTKYRKFWYLPNENNYLNMSPEIITIIMTGNTSKNIVSKLITPPSQGNRFNHFGETQETLLVALLKLIRASHSQCTKGFPPMHAGGGRKLKKKNSWWVSTCFLFLIPMDILWVTTITVSITLPPPHTQWCPLPLLTASSPGPCGVRGKTQDPVKPRWWSTAATWQPPPGGGPGLARWCMSAEQYEATDTSWPQSQTMDGQC